MSARLQLHPQPLATMVCLLGVAVMVAAGFWQRGRGIEKRALIAAHAAAAKARPVAIAALADAPPRGERWPAEATGHYEPAQTLALDNQTHERVPGVHVLTAFVIEDGRRLVVDRGWLPLGVAPGLPPTGLQTIQGLWRRLPEPGMRLGTPPKSGCMPLPTGSRVNYPDLELLRCQWGTTVRDGLFELSPAAAGGFTRAWAAEAEAVPPARHFVYAAQWWLFAATLLFFTVRLNLRRIPATPESPSP